MTNHEFSEVRMGDVIVYCTYCGVRFQERDTMRLFEGIDRGKVLGIPMHDKCADAIYDIAREGALYDGG